MLWSTLFCVHPVYPDIEFLKKKKKNQMHPQSSVRRQQLRCSARFPEERARALPRGRNGHSRIDFPLLWKQRAFKMDSRGKSFCSSEDIKRCCEVRAQLSPCWLLLCRRLLRLPEITSWKTLNLCEEDFNSLFLTRQADSAEKRV